MNRSMRLAAVTLATCLSGCATVTNNPKDPLEGFNRTMFSFNDKVDQVALKPAAQAYRAVVPSFVQTGVGNFFGNLGDVWTGLNNILQGKIGDGASDFMRFAVNSTLGLGGVIDIGSAAGMPKHKEDFGQTLGKWGVGPGAYVVLPLLGSSTVRDTAALPLDFKGDLWSYADPVRLRNSGTAVRLLDARAAVLDASDLIEGAALDRYEFVRDAYLQRRENKINDGEAPRSKGDSTAPGQNSDRPSSSGSKGGNDKDDYPAVGPTPEPTTTVPPPAPAKAAPKANTSSLDGGSGAAAAAILVTEIEPAELPAVAEPVAMEPDGQIVVKNERLVVLTPAGPLPAQ